MAVHVKLSADGKVPLPPEVLEQLGLIEGDDLRLEVTDKGLVINSTQASVRRAQALTREMLLGKADFTVDDFLRWKREEVALEEAKLRRMSGE